MNIPYLHIHKGKGKAVIMPVCFTVRERSPSTHWNGGWVDPRSSVDIMDKRKISFPAMN
jgi:hypothetical protein